MLLAGVAIRLWLIGGLYIHPDEAWHIYTASQPTFADVIACTFREEVHPPLFYLLLHAVMRISDSPLALRFCSLLPWMLWVPLCWRIGAELGGNRYGIIWAGLAALSNASLEYSLAIREYMWMLLFITLQFGCMLRLWRKPDPWAAIVYCICGILAIGFEYSAAIAIFAMGGLLAWRMQQLRCEPAGPCAALLATHLLLAAFLGWMMSQHAIYHLEHIFWKHDYYYSDSLVAVLLFLKRLSGFLLPLDATWEQLPMLFFLVVLQPFWRRFPVMAVLLGAECLLMLILNSFHLYPPPSVLRFTTWMLPAIMAWLAFGLEYMILLSGRKLRWLLATGGAVAVTWSAYAGVMVPNALLVSHYQEFLQTVRAIPESDLIFTDIQTMMQLKYRSHWQVVTHNPHLDAAKWEGHTVLYPNWFKIDIVDTQTGKREGDISLHMESLPYFAEALKGYTKDANIQHVWMISAGFSVSLDKDCIERLRQSGAAIWDRKQGMVARFTPSAFMDFTRDCIKRA